MSLREFLGLGAALSSLPIPREFDLRTEGETEVAERDATDAVVVSVPASSYVEQFTEDGGIRVRSYPEQSDAPVEVVFKTAIGEAALGLNPSEAETVAESLQSAAAECRDEEATCD